MSSRLLLPLLLIATLSANLGGCGFHLRGQQNYPFNSLAVPATSVLASEIKRAVAASSDMPVQDEAAGADAVLHILHERSEKVILSLNSQGRVREYQLRYLVSYSISRAGGGEYIPSSTTILTRDMTFNDQVLSKEGEEALLYREMRGDFVQQLMRRMAAAKPIVIQ